LRPLLQVIQQEWEMILDSLWDLMEFIKKDNGYYTTRFYSG
jgi:hypothetical protein